MKVRVTMDEVCKVDVTFEASEERAAELIALAKKGKWKEIGEQFAGTDPSDSEVDVDSITLEVDGKEVYED